MFSPFAISLHCDTWFDNIWICFKPNIQVDYQKFFVSILNAFVALLCQPATSHSFNERFFNVLCSWHLVRCLWFICFGVMNYSTLFTCIFYLYLLAARFKFCSLTWIYVFSSISLSSYAFILNSSPTFPWIGFFSDNRVLLCSRNFASAPGWVFT